MFENSIQISSQDAIDVKKGTVLIREGEVGNCAFLVLEGRFQVIREMNQKKVVLGEIRPVDIVGEMAILDEMPRSASVVAIEDSRVIELNKHRMKMIIRRYPDIAEVVLKLLCSKLRSTAKKLVESEIRYSEIVDYFSEKPLPTETEQKQVVGLEVSEKDKLAESRRRHRMVSMERRNK